MNNAIFYFFYNLANQSVFFDKLVIFLAVYFPYIVIMLAGLFILFHHEIFKAENPYRVFWEKKREMLAVVFSGGVAWILSVILKNLFHALRPVLALPDIHPLIAKTSYAFPSEHATFFMALAFSTFFLHRKAGYVFMIFALLIGLARIAAGVHFPIDILGGFVLGALIAYFVKNV